MVVAKHWKTCLFMAALLPLVSACIPGYRSSFLDMSRIRTVAHDGGGESATVTNPAR